MNGIVKRMGYMGSMQFSVADAHNDFLCLMRKGAKLDAPIDGSQHMTLTGMRAGNMKLVFFAAFPADREERARAMTNALLMIHDYHRMVEEYGLVHLGHGMGVGAIGEGQIGTLLTIEGADALAGNIEMVEIFHRLGVRLMTLTWNHRNELADGVGEEYGGGLSGFGREVISEMNRLKMIVDVSHINETGFWDVMRCSKLPPMASHSNAKAVCGHRRNLTDEQIVALRDAGGFVGLNYLADFLSDGGGATIADVVRHVDHFASLGALSILGLGSDFDGITKGPEGVNGPQDVPLIFEALLQAGYSGEQVRGIAFDNLSRFLEQYCE